MQHPKVFQAGRPASLRLPPTFPVVLPIIRKLRIAQYVDELCPMKAGDHEPHGVMVEFLILHLLQSMDRYPLYKMDQWAERHHVELLLGCEASKFNDHRLGRALDAVSDVVCALESKVVTRALRCYEIPVLAVHWDLTHILFSGAYDRSEVVRPGYGNGAMHAKQVHESLYVSSEHGFPLMHNVLPGNAQQAPLAEELLLALQDRLKTTNLIVIADCAGLSYDIMDAYTRAGAHFLGPLEVTASEREFILAAPAEQFVELSYRSKRDKHCVHSCYDTMMVIKRDKKSSSRTVRALVIHSTSKHKADSAERRGKLQKVLARLQDISRFLNKSHYTKFSFALRQLVKAVPPELAGVVTYDLQGEDKHLRLRFTVDEAALEQMEQTDGRYLLVTDVTDESADALFRTYKQHTAVEARFCHLKTDLTIEPVWLRRDNRIAALIAIFMLALAVYAILGICSERAKLEGDHYHKMTARQIFFHFDYVAILMGPARADGTPEYWELIIRDDQAYILQKLGFPDPETYIQLLP